MQLRVPNSADTGVNQPAINEPRFHWKIKEVTHFSLPHYIWGWNGTITIAPTDATGIEINGILVSPETLIAEKEPISCARFLSLVGKDGKKIRVVEHIISALWAAWITQAKVTAELSMWYFPVIWPGIEPIYSAIRSKVVPTQQQDVYKYNGPQNQRIQSGLYEDAYMEISPSDSFELSIEATNRDISALPSEPLVIQDVYAEVSEHSDARAIARIQQAMIYYGFKIWQIIPGIEFKGVSDIWYIVPPRTATGDEIVSLMRDRYIEDGRNEQYGHTLASDFMSEIHTFFPWQIKAKIKIVNGGHQGRVDVLRKIKDMGILTRIANDNAVVWQVNRIIAAE